LIRSYQLLIYTGVLDEIYKKVKVINNGEVTQLIPNLSRKNPDLFGFAVCTVNGKRYSAGDCEEAFCVLVLIPLPMELLLNLWRREGTFCG
jgi:glutaminase